MPISKIGSKALVDCSVAAVDIADNSITAAKLAGSITNAKLANSSVTINNTSVSLGASANVNALDWQSVITADGSTGTTGVAGRGYFINTTSAAHTFTLPTSATRGDTIAIKDYAGTFATYNLTIARNGHKIQGVENNSLISTNRASVVLVYVDVTRGWEFVTESNVAELVPVFISATGGTVTTSGNFKIHTFTGDGCFVVSTVGNAPTVPTGGPSNVDYLVVAGGGSGGSGIGGGGGAGGLRFSASTYTPPPTSAPRAGSALSVTTTTYPVTVGSGSAFTPSNSQPPSLNRGSNSVFSTITSTGGGSGGNGQTGGGACGQGQPGGSGGAGGYNASGGSGNTPPVSPSQGNTGGNVHPNNVDTGGGGGAGAVGANGVCGTGGAGGDGLQINITGSNTYYAGGGGGINYNCNVTTTVSGAGGLGGGGAGGKGGWYSPAPLLAVAGTANTGGGGGGGNEVGGAPGPNPQGGPANSQSGGSGGSGIVIIRYQFQ